MPSFLGRRRHLYNPDVTAESEVVRFIRDDLGCGCPEDVLRSIRVDRSSPVGATDSQAVRIDVGHRLLVWVVVFEDDTGALADLVTSVVANGLDERDRLSFNRLRVVLASDGPLAIDEAARRAFDACLPPDDRVHLHVVDLQSLPASLRPCR